MLDINRIRKESDKIIELLSRRGNDYSGDIEKIKADDENWRENLAKVEKLRQEKNDVSKEIGILMKEGGCAKEQISQMKKISDEIKNIDEGFRKNEYENNLLLMLPNLPDENVETDDKVIKEEGRKKEFDFEPMEHWEIGEILQILDFKIAAKLSGSRFAMLLEEGAELERALINFMLDIHKEKHGYKEIMPPYLVKSQIMTGTGQLPKFKNEMYSTREEEAADDKYLIPTAEVPLANMHREEILEEKDLPKKYTAYTPCFRREAGSYGKDTKGLIRNHQFNKVELVNIVVPEESEKFHQKLLAESEEILKQLELTYRIVELGTKELGFAASKTYDLEVWMPGEKIWREISSCSNCRDFQARRMKTKYRISGSGTEYVHTLNSSGLAVGRIFAAILENYQTEQINVIIPDVLKKYMNNKEQISRQDEK
ncbi:serine--tRNA ligase [Elusimicrobiota bacterium]